MKSESNSAPVTEKPEKSKDNWIQRLSPLDTDKGYAWIICAATSINNFLTLSLPFSIGIYYVTFKEIYQQSSGTTSWLSSLKNL